MTTLKIRPLVGKAYPKLSVVAKPDQSLTNVFADIAELVKLNNPTGQIDDDTLVCDLQLFCDAPDFDRDRDLRLWKNSRGNLIGFGQLLITQQTHNLESNLYFGVHPRWRGNGLDAEILQWSEQRMREVVKERVLPAQLRLSIRDNQLLHRMLLKQQSYTTERRFLTMACPLDQSFSSPSLPDGFTLRSLAEEQDLKAWVDLFNESFIDHWDHHDITVDTLRRWLKNPGYQPELSSVAVAPDGTFAAFCMGYINQGENSRNPYNNGWIKLLGTRRGFRKLGLGRAMLLTGIKQLKARGVDWVQLGVDADSPTSATRLYQSIGFQTVHTWLSYAKEIQPPCLRSRATLASMPITIGDIQ
ncbi:MAG TPA: GNAT family N-acetyltransferase [Coleofasciculaceae cyanobacterium]